MNQLKVAVFDIEANGFDPDKIWVLSAAVFSEGEWRVKTTSDYDDMRRFFTSYDVYVGHNIVRFDVPAVEKILDIEITGKYADTLGLSWTLYPNRIKHGLEDWGEYFGIPKPKILDGEWLGPLENETYEQFIDKMSHRCSEDVRINCQLWDKVVKDLLNLYDGDQHAAWRYIAYLTFKLDCVAEAENSKWLLDVDMCSRELARFEIEKELKIDELKKAMPKAEITAKVNPPSKPKKKDGSPSATGLRWAKLLEDLGLPPDHNETVEYVKGYKEGNPNSVPQVKDWLFSLGWEPETFDYKKEGTGRSAEVRKIPQIRKEVGGEKVLCHSVTELIEEEPAIELLEGLTILTHRIGLLKGFLKSVDSDGYIKAQASGFTNTLRLKHKTIVNLPGVRKPYGDIIRGVLKAPEGFELCGSDMSSLEDRTKQHYMWKYDPDYVKTMLTDGFDPHLTIAVQAGFITQEDSDFYKWAKNQKELSNEDKKRFKQIDGERHKGKTTNYSATYGAGGSTIARAAKIPKKSGEALHRAYWEVNWSLNAIAEDARVKDCLGTKWIFNPVSGFWYSLRHDKDRFSTLNQGTGVFCFDVWIKNFREIRPQLTGQFHDEIIICVKKGYRKEVEEMLRNAIDMTNEQLQLNRELDIDVQFGDSYAEIH
jgi:hypothetical protein